MMVYNGIYVYLYIWIGKGSTHTVETYYLQLGSPLLVSIYTPCQPLPKLFMFICTAKLFTDFLQKIPNYLVL